ncbi:polysaccharide biosynthesis/export family protein [Sphingomonas solaris]|uniref:Polysaccharide export protein n=1 Tax=Alterirhizorhabdus solaris TaxID=2529389 RepID=A0A558QXT2_9SPHN|nr:polysaccharide biosynthesis/export family protein [Sphingomonas solaris]TVV71976.1 polysaccharide export protein [Sphingomonas solaris]
MIHISRGLRRITMPVAALAAIASALSGCAGSVPPLPTTAVTPADGVYRLGLGDKLRVNIYGEPQLSGEYQVSGNGAVTLPLVGDVPAVGLTARDLETALTGRYAAGYLRSPRIAVEVYDFRPYFILGEIQKPGRYPSVEGQTVLGAIATAGGFTYRANTKRVFLRRANEQAEYSVDANSSVQIRPGDVIRVGERYF